MKPVASSREVAARRPCAGKSGDDSLGRGVAKSAIIEPRNRIAHAAEEAHNLFNRNHSSYGRLIIQASSLKCCRRQKVNPPVAEIRRRRIKPPFSRNEARGERRGINSKNREAEMRKIS